MTDQGLERVQKIKDNLKDTLLLKETKEKIFSSDFYREIDRARNKNFCSLPLIIAALLIIFIFLVYGMFYVRNYTHSGINFILSNEDRDQPDLRDSFFNKTHDVKAQDTVSIDFDEVEVGNYLGIAQADFPLKKATLHISQRGIIITGRTSNSIFSLPVQVIIKPKIDQSKLVFIFDDIQTGSISLPAAVKDQLSVYLNNVMKSKNLYDESLEIVSATTFDGLLRLEVHKTS